MKILAERTKKDLEEFLFKAAETTVASLLRSVLISLVLLLFPILLLMLVDKAEQLILSEIEEDPVITTFFVYAVCLVNLYVFAQRHKATGNSISEIGKTMQLLIGAILLGPLCFWVWALFHYSGDDKSIIVISCILSALFIFDLWTNIRSLLIKDTYESNSLERTFDKFFYRLAQKTGVTRLFNLNPGRIREGLEISSSDFRYYRLKRIIFWCVFISLVYNIINYEWFDISDRFGNPKPASSGGNTFNTMLAIVMILIAYRYWFFMNYFIVEENRKNRWKIVFNILFLLITVGAIIILMQVGTFQAFDIILIFTLTLRYVLILWPLAIRHIVYKWRLFSQKGFFREFFTWNIPALKLGLSVLFVSLILIFMTDWFFWKDNERMIYEMETRSYNPEGRIPLDSAIIKRIKADSDSSKGPIILVLGQGGGSRAGATMFDALSGLDTAGYGENIFAIISISGSSNGAGFYLNTKINKAKKDSLIQERNLKTGKDSSMVVSKAKILYHHDYITASLFKMLYTDFVFSEFPRLKIFEKRKNRNEQLIADEAKRSKVVTENNSTSVLEAPWSKIYPDRDTAALPLFFPVTYNVSRGSKGVSSPYAFNIPVSSPGTYYSLYDSLSKTGKELTLGQSIALSEMFPFISASATVKTGPCTYENFMDGGVYDNMAYEVAHDIYNAVSKARGAHASKRPIVIIAVQNGEIYKDPQFRFKTDAKAVIASASNAIFKTNVISHEEALLKELKGDDKLLHIYSFKKRPVNNSPCCGEADSTVVMSRFLTRKEIDQIDFNVRDGVKKVTDTFKAKNLPSGKETLNSKPDSSKKVVFNIVAKEPYSTEYLRVRKGEQYVFYVDPCEKWIDAFITSDADGFNNILLPEWLKRVKGEKCFTLCATLNKDDTNAFAIGKQKTWIAPKDGNLYFFANDSKCFYRNNKGCIKLNIEQTG